MRSDGTVTYLFVEHEVKEGKWATSSLEHFLFHDLTSAEHHGRIGNHYRELLAPQSASSDLWQKYDIHGFAEEKHAMTVLYALRERHPTRKFRLCRRVIFQHTVVVAA